jgi:two-component system sensor histidine kinase BarA
MNSHQSANALSWDRQEAIRKVGNDPEIADTLFQTLVKNLDQQILGMTEAFRQQDWNSIGQTLHKLLGSSKICATPRLENLLLALNCCAKTHDAQTMPNLFADLQQEAQSLKDCAEKPPISAP